MSDSYYAVKKTLLTAPPRECYLSRKIIAYLKNQNISMTNFIEIDFNEIAAH